MILHLQSQEAVSYTHLEFTVRRLELGHINIKDIQFGPESKIEDGVLYVDEEAVKAIVLEDERIKDCKLSLIHISVSQRLVKGTPAI